MSLPTVAPELHQHGDVSHQDRKDSGCDISSPDVIPKSFSLPNTLDSDIHDLVCIGFGPASLAIATALHDMLEENHIRPPKVRFLERQQQFAWHAGMLLPGTKMQISFIKDLATLRCPRSKFTFLNYLQENNRLVQFSNLDTFLPFRVEFEDYLKWAAAHFENAVSYGQDVRGVRPVKLGNGERFDCLEVSCHNDQTGTFTKLLARNVVVAVGGRPSRPNLFPASLKRAIHSSQYDYRISALLPDTNKDYNVAVIGSGQSAAEIFHNLHSRYPNAKTQMIIRDTALRPSDDSPFVNEVFNPDATDEFFHQTAEDRQRSIQRNKATNYSVVRPSLLENIYEDLYHQYLHEPDKTRWRNRILTTREVASVSEISSTGQVSLTLQNTSNTGPTKPEILRVDAVILATGYVRDVHTEILRDCQAINGASNGSWKVGRDYSVALNREKVDNGVGIWLQGCNESTHGLADSLLSILATRSGELVKSLFLRTADEGHGKSQLLHRKIEMLTS